MSSKKTHPTEPETEPIPGETGAPATAPEQAEGTGASPALEELQKQLAEAQSQAAEYKDGWQRSVADFQNYRRRIEAERAETYQTAVGSVLKRYLPVVDDLERALAARPADLAWADGIDLIYRKLQSILEAEGVKRIEAVGQQFDPNFHEAITQEPSQEYASGQVIEVTRNGYTLGDKVLRPAMVRVAQ
ncbi:MAG TPA: nucleotide exchange factor GrpE [Anaerolineales bacterium]|nr:nucleotide exchange factor GrpE [Anaerolineales bacterium]